MHSECKPCHFGQTPWLLCFLLAIGGGFYDAVGDTLLKSRESGDKVAGYAAKGLGKVVDTAYRFYCQN